MSLERFKLILRTLLSENIRANSWSFFVLFLPLTLCSKKDWEAVTAPKLEALIDKSCEAYRTFSL